MFMPGRARQPEWIRMKEAKRITGWSRDYLRKLAERGVITVLKPFPGAWWFYDRQELLALLNGSQKSKT